MQDLEALRRFYVNDALGGQSLFDIWERGEAWGDSITPTTYSASYRAWILAKLERCLAEAGGDRLLGVGCGNAVIEAELRARGRSVLAIDVLPEAVDIALRKGVDAKVADASTWEPPHRQWHVIYADGFLGHLYDPGTECEPILRRLGGWLEPRRGVLVISNDAAASDAGDVQPADGVHGFHWLSASYIARRLERVGYEVREREKFVYERPFSGPRRRAVVTAGCAA